MGPYRRRLLLLLVPAVFLAACKDPPSNRAGEKVLRYPLRAKVGSLDPVAADSQYRNMVVSAIFDTLIEFRYPRRPYVLKPSLLATMPEVSDDGRIYRFTLKAGVKFADDPCFSGGKGREIVSRDVFYSIRRSCDPHFNPVGYWLLKGRIVGLDAYKAEQARLRRKQGEAFRFDYERPIEGFREIDDRRFEVILTKPFPQFLYILTMGYLAIVPREAVARYDLEFGQHPVGSGPYKVEEFLRGSWISLVRNPSYREERILADVGPDEAGVGLEDDVGRRVPFLDRIVLEIYQQDQPMWLKFLSGDLDIVQVPAEYWPTVFNKDRTLKRSVKAQGIRNENLPLLDLIYWGFNMEDPVWGRPPEAKLLRKAIAYTVDLESRNRVFYNNQNTLYQGPIPPGLEGYVPGHRRRDLGKARELLARAGHPDGKGLPVLQYETSRSGNSKEQGEMLRRLLREVGIRVEVNLNSFPELTDKLNKRKASMFGLAWGADYPDAENFLQLFYGPNEAPGSNVFNYKNPVFDRLFEKARIMLPSDERTRLYRQLRQMIIDDQPMIGSMARTRFYLWNPRVKNFRPEEIYSSFWKYIDVEEPRQQGLPGGRS